MPIDSIHDGHRNRLRGKYLKNGPDALSDHELIELLLFYSKPRVNTNDTAHAIINELGSLDEVFSADIDRLKLTDGVGEKNLEPNENYHVNLTVMPEGYEYASGETEYPFDSENVCTIVLKAVA